MHDFFFAPIATESLTFKCLLLVACHHFGDFAFQSTWMAAGKSKSWEVNFYHALMYSILFVPLAFVPGFAVTFAGLLVIFITHFWIDPCKARWNFVKTIWQDQLFHYVTLAVLVAAGLI